MGAMEMDLASRLREIMEKEYGIKTDSELMEAIKNQEELDFGIFVTPLKHEIERAS